MTTSDTILCILLGVAIGLAPWPSFRVIIGAVVLGAIGAVVLALVPTWLTAAVLGGVAYIAIQRRATARRRRADYLGRVQEESARLAEMFSVSVGCFHLDNLRVASDGTVLLTPVPRPVMTALKSTEASAVDEHVARLAPGMRLQVHHNFDHLQLVPVVDESGRPR